MKKISELIDELEAIKITHGNLPVVLDDESDPTVEFNLDPYPAVVLG